MVAIPANIATFSALAALVLSAAVPSHSKSLSACHSDCMKNFYERAKCAQGEPGCYCKSLRNSSYMFLADCHTKCKASLSADENANYYNFLLGLCPDESSAKVKEDNENLRAELKAMGKKAEPFTLPPPAPPKQEPAPSLKPNPPPPPPPPAPAPSPVPDPQQPAPPPPPPPPPPVTTIPKPEKKPTPLPSPPPIVIREPTSTKSTTSKTIPNPPTPPSADQPTPAPTKIEPLFMNNAITIQKARVETIQAGSGRCSISVGIPGIPGEPVRSEEVGRPMPFRLRFSFTVLMMVMEVLVAFALQVFI